MNSVTIDFKYDVGENVWFILDGKVRNEKIETVYFDFFINSPFNDGDNKRISDEPVTYHILMEAFEESKLFKTREELINSL